MLIHEMAKHRGRRRGRRAEQHKRREHGIDAAAYIALMLARLCLYRCSSLSECCREPCRIGMFGDHLRQGSLQAGESVIKLFASPVHGAMIRPRQWISDENARMELRPVQLAGWGKGAFFRRGQSIVVVPDQNKGPRKRPFVLDGGGGGY